ncbi:periplasmic protein involved in polysaccharide export [Burkholderia sp. Ch1-1]|nr:periplasmic protein involved in polysaccharide export [Burkholderia sp. Ch1-1]
MAKLGKLRVGSLLEFNSTGLKLLCCSACLALSACAAAPGMRMRSPATLPVADATSSQPAPQLQIPIIDVNFELLNKLRDEAANAPADAAQNLMNVRGDGYTLGVGDVLQITVWDHPEFAAALGAQPATAVRTSDPASGIVVDQSGNVQFPYVGSIHVAGLRPEQVQAVVAKGLSRYFKDPQVTVRVGSFRAKQVFVDGEVRTPGAVPITDIPMTLYEAISAGGGLTPAADQSRIVLVRDGTSYPIDLTRMLERGENPSRIVLKNGDLLRVVARDDNGVFVMGEVTRPATALPLKNGRLTLSEALSQAGSINSASADAAQLYVIRGSRGTAPKIYHLDAASPVSMVLANEFQLQPKDIVYVDGNGLVRLNRVLSLLMPAINAGLTAAIVTK